MYITVRVLEGVPYASSSPCTWLMRAKMSSRLFLHSCIIFTYTGRNTQECTYVFLSNICMLGIRKSEHLPSSLFLFFLAPSYSISLPPSPNRAFVFFRISPIERNPTTRGKMPLNDSRYSAFLRVEIKR